jgi:AcrR family transcriptional regulator
MALGRSMEEAPLVNRLLDAAEDEIAAVGIADFRIRAIARRAGVSHQAPGHHFGDRAGLLTVLATRGFRALGEQLTLAEKNAAQEDSPGDRVAALGNAYVTFAMEHGALFTVMFRPEHHRPDDPELSAARQEAFDVLLRSVAAARAAGWGRLHSEQSLALTCWAAVHGAVTLWREGTYSVFFPGARPEDLGREVTRALAAALGAEA